MLWIAIKDGNALLRHTIYFVMVKENCLQRQVMAVQKNYDENITDEFIRACKIGDPKEGLIKDGDAVFCYNFRTDRLREITEVLSQSKIEGTSMKPLKLDYFTMTKYDEKFQNINIVFEKNDIAMSIG
jgi:2,3-bisphosphoglycerate-independent phosphoglycerate mutase